MFFKPLYSELCPSQLNWFKYCSSIIPTLQSRKMRFRGTQNLFKVESKQVVEPGLGLQFVSLQDITFFQGPQREISLGESSGLPSVFQSSSPCLVRKEWGVTASWQNSPFFRPGVKVVLCSPCSPSFLGTFSKEHCGLGNCCFGKCSQLQNK